MQFADEPGAREHLGPLAEGRGIQLFERIEGDHSTILGLPLLPVLDGGQIVATVLCSPELRALWEAELATMRNRIKLMRALLVERGARVE